MWGRRKSPAAPPAADILIGVRSAVQCNVHSFIQGYGGAVDAGYGHGVVEDLQTLHLHVVVSVHSAVQCALRYPWVMTRQWMRVHGRGVVKDHLEVQPLHLQHVRGRTVQILLLCRAQRRSYSSDL